MFLDIGFTIVFFCFVSCQFSLATFNGDELSYVFFEISTTQSLLNIFFFRKSGRLLHSFVTFALSPLSTVAISPYTSRVNMAKQSHLRPSGMIGVIVSPTWFKRVWAQFLYQWRREGPQLRVLAKQTQREVHQTKNLSVPWRKWANLRKVLFLSHVYFRVLIPDRNRVLV